MVEYPCAVCGVRNRVPRARLADDPVCGSCKQKLFPRSPVPASDITFRIEVEESPLPVLVDFWAPWCAPCRVIAPVLDELAHSRAARLKVVKVNVDESPDVAARFSVESIPTLKLFVGGRVVDSMVGALPRAQLLARLEQALHASS
jgi:thioredoxin 2